MPRRCLALAASLAVLAMAPRSAAVSDAGRRWVAAPLAPLGEGFIDETEPNGTAATATPLGGTAVVVRGTVFPASDIDVYSFVAAAGDQVHSGIQTLQDASGNGDSVLELVSTDGSTVIETDNNDGTFSDGASIIAGRALVAPGTYFLRVRHNLPSGTIRPYHLHFRLQSGTPVAEVESNNQTATATPLPATGWVSGVVTAVTPAEVDFFSLTLDAGDSVFVSLDMNPERDAAVWSGRLAFGQFGNPPADQWLLVNDGNSGAVATDPNAEALFFTVLNAGTYYVRVDSVVAAGLGATATYRLSATVRPAVPATPSCTTYTATDTPQTIPSIGSVSSTITVPGNPRIADLDVSVNLDHLSMHHLDAQILSPAGNQNGLFSDIGSAVVGNLLMDVRFDDEAALPPASALSASFALQPEREYRLSWFDGEDAGGTWTLVLRDDTADSGGTLNGWSITVCESPPPPGCAPGTAPVTVYASDFEATDGGFTHSGAGDEWERGLPTAAPITSCNGGTGCWKTDLDANYNANSSQDLLSPPMDLRNLVGPAYATWFQRHQIETATFDRAFVAAQVVGGSLPATHLWRWLDFTMRDTVGSPLVTIEESAGWAEFNADVSSYLGQSDFQLRFHLDTDGSLHFGGMAVDDVRVTACQPGAATANLSMAVTDGVATATPGGSVVYTVTASNSGPSMTTATIGDTFPASLTCNWTCLSAGGATCTAAGSGNIDDGVSLPSGGVVTYTASCAIASAATGILSNVATVSGPLSDPVPGNNSSTDVDTLTPVADLGISQIAGTDPIGVHQTLTYSLVITNGGPSDAADVTVSDVLPINTAFVSATPGSPGCTHSEGVVVCSVGGLPAGDIVSLTILVETTAPGNAGNTASVSSPSSDSDPSNNSAVAVTPVAFVKGDLDNDLGTDLFIANTITNEHRVWLMSGEVAVGDGVLDPPAPGMSSQRVVGVDDFGDDFRNDLVFWNSANGAVEVWMMNGLSRQGAPVPLSDAPTLSPNWKLSATGDFNADGEPDIVWRNQTSQKLVIWTMNDTSKVGSIIPTPDLAQHANWEIVAAQDLNADGSTDFLWYNATSGKIVYWWMDSSVVRVAGNFTNPANAGDNNWKVLAGGDYGVGMGGLPGTKDLVWRNATSGNFVIWFMDSAGNRTFGTFTSPAAPSETPTDWIIVGPR